LEYITLRKYLAIQYSYRKWEHIPRTKYTATDLIIYIIKLFIS